MGGASSEKSGKERLSQLGIIRSDSCMMEKSQEPPPAQQHVPEIQGGDFSNIKQTRGSAKEQGRPQSLRESDKSNGKEMKILDWSKDTGDKFYSLTEESEFSSAEGHSLSDYGSSISSEEGNASLNNELTVRQRRNQRKCTKTRSGSQEGTELSASSGSRTLKWDYSSINLTDVARTTNKSNMGVQQLLGSNDRGDNIEVAKSDICAANTDSGMLQSIFNSIKEFQMETRIESRQARVATKRLQGSVRKVAKSCTEIETKLCAMEERIVAVEEEVDTLKQQNAMQENQMTDVMWKLEDLENRQRRNNLRFLGIEEGLEGNDIRGYMIKLLQGTFPELNHWGWNNEIQLVEALATARNVPSLQVTTASPCVNPAPGSLSQATPVEKEQGKVTEQGTSAAKALTSADGTGLDTLLSRPGKLAAHVAPDIKEKIWKGEFVDIFSLIRAKKRDVETKDKGAKASSSSDKKPKTEESNMNWLFGFNVFMSVMLERKPETGIAMICYPNKILKAHHMYGGNAWLEYDRDFRWANVEDPAIGWDQTEVNGWLECVNNKLPSKQPFRAQYTNDKKGVQQKGIVPKKDPGQFRLIHNLSAPRGSSVNKAIDPVLCSVRYATVDQALEKLRVLGRGTLLAKTDTEAAFQLLPVHPEDYHLLGFQYNGDYFYDKCMPMGCSVSCSYFEHKTPPQKERRAHVASARDNKQRRAPFSHNGPSEGGTTERARYPRLATATRTGD
ncbi:hypothetical protein NDU88_003289 [Pleurodeles waltl]|uniref:Uncharacterized protein n=1 Tax=Pleurodeles waltl TaxID=8319 RepID=A0AAV7TNL9_PLEWA|nr:hypothetical protein NDU88_003289 [Pleurodeles waltl]